jgi:hypothetical protein
MHLQGIDYIFKSDADGLVAALEPNRELRTAFVLLLEKACVKGYEISLFELKLVVKDPIVANARNAGHPCSKFESHLPLDTLLVTVDVEKDFDVLGKLSGRVLSWRRGFRSEIS